MGLESGVETGPPSPQTPEPLFCGPPAGIGFGARGDGKEFGTFVSGVLLVRTPAAIISVDLDIGSPQARCALRSFGGPDYPLWQCSIAAVRTVEPVPIVGMVRQVDLRARKHYVAFHGRDARAILTHDAVAKALSDLRHQGFTFDTNMDYVFCHVPSPPMTDLIVEKVFSHIYIWNGAVKSGLL